MFLLATCHKKIYLVIEIVVVVLPSMMIMIDAYNSETIIPEKREQTQSKNDDINIVKEQQIAD